jgi:transposase
VPALRRGDAVVWDNLSPHKAAGVAEAVEPAGTRLMPLPPYSPDLSPIEPMWSKVKQDLRGDEARTPQSLGDAAAHAFASIAAADARG